jgi:hypothetical protein
MKIVKRKKGEGEGVPCGVMIIRAQRRKVSTKQWGGFGSWAGTGGYRRCRTQWWREPVCERGDWAGPFGCEIIINGGWAFLSYRSKSHHPNPANTSQSSWCWPSTASAFDVYYLMSNGVCLATSCYHILPFRAPHVFTVGRW